MEHLFNCSLLILGILYGIRYAYFRFIIRRDIMPERRSKQARGAVWMQGKYH